MNTKFINTYHNALPEDLIDALIKQSDYMGAMVEADAILDEPVRWDVPKDIRNRKDEQCFLSRVNVPLHKKVMQAISPMLASYIEEYGLKTKGTQMVSSEIKLQKTLPGGGFHDWHFEHGPDEDSHRAAVWAVYLNDIEEGGETQFLFQNLLVKPKRGDLVVFPAGFTHTHRGNPPLDKDKYIITSWVLYRPYQSSSLASL